MTKTTNIFNKIYDYLVIFIHKFTNKNDTIKSTNQIVDKPFEVSFIGKCSGIPGQYKPQTKAQKTKEIIIDWIKSFNHDYFLTIQFPNNMKIANFEISKRYLHKVMANFELNLLGRHWNKKHLFFMAFAEKGKSDYWHYHILFNSDKFTTEQIQTALDKTTKFMKFSNYNLYLKLINKDDIYSYCTKEIRIKNNGNFYCDNIILSNDLFNI